MTANSKEESANVQETQQAQKPNDKEYNFAQLRKQLETERNERIALQQRIEQSEKEKTKKVVEEDDESSDEPYVDEKRLNKKLARFEERFARTVDEKAEAKARQMLEAEKQAMFLKSNPDFSEVLREEVIQKFAEKHPEIAEPMLEMPNSFARQKLLYQNIKALGINKPPEAKQSIQETVDKNRRSPYYQPSNVAAAPYASAGDFSENGQKAAYEKMKELKSRLRI